ncbi:MAG: penicillin-binding protein [Bdellovibrionales bacterium]
MKSRLVVVFFICSVMWCGLVFRAAFLQILPNARLEKLHSKQFNTVVALTPRRGLILDRNGVELAASVAAYSLYADPSLVDSPRKTAFKLAPLIGESPDRLYKKMKDRDRRFTWLARRLDLRAKEKIDKLKLRGVEFVEESRRIFPNEYMLSQVLGFVGNEGQGLEGLEARFEDTLQGKKKKISMSRDARGRPLIVNGRVFSEAVDGSDIQLTIDSTLQYALEQELDAAAKAQDAISAVGVVLDAQTSEILAMASLPTFNPNQPLKFVGDHRRNRSITDPIEPGSTIKTFTIAGILKAGLAAPNTKFDCENGSFKIGKRKIGEAHRDQHWGMLTVSEILALSSNIGSAKIGFQMGAPYLEQTLREFGFGEKTGIELTGESRGLIPPLPWNDHLLANISFGHGISTTPLQLANAYAAVANGGVLNRPFLVKEIRNKETGEVEFFEPKKIRKVLEEKDAASLRYMLMGVTSEGATGIKARVKGFPVAGKTGTSQKLKEDGTYSHQSFISSFAGFIPANDPKYVIYIAVDDPKVSYYGSELAAPIFSKIASIAVRRGGLSPTLISQENVLRSGGFTTANNNKIARHVAAQVDAEGAVMPSLKGLTLREALSLLQPHGIQVKISGHGRVASMWPEAGQPFTESRKVHLFLEDKVSR